MIQKISVIEGEVSYTLNGKEEVCSFCFENMSLLDYSMEDIINQVVQEIINVLCDKGKTQVAKIVATFDHVIEKEYTIH